MLFQDIKGVFVVEINCGLWEDRQQEEDQLISRMLDLRALLQVSCGGILHVLDYNYWHSPKNYLYAVSMQRKAILLT